MTAVDLPPMRSGNWRGIYVEAAELAGHHIWAVTVRTHGLAAGRRWFPNETAAYAYGASEADRLDLPLFDFRDPGAEP